MKKTNQRIYLKPHQYWSYFSFPLLFLVLAIYSLINGELHQFFFDTTSFNINEKIWVSNFWLLLAIYIFRKRWLALYFYEIPIQIADVDFEKKIGPIANQYNWKSLSTSSIHMELIRFDKSDRRQDLINIHRYQNKVLFASISYPRWFNINLLYQSLYNAIIFRNSIFNDKTPNFQLKAEKEQSLINEIYLYYLLIPLLLALGVYELFASFEQLFHLFNNNLPWVIFFSFVYLGYMHFAINTLVLSKWMSDE